MPFSQVSRREFTKKLILASSTIGLSALAARCSKNEQDQVDFPIGIQLYTVRELTKTDFTGTITKIAKMGYDAVEFAGYGNLTAPQVKALLDDLGLQCAGTHEGFGNLDNNLQERIDFNLAIGNEYIVCPSMPEEWRQNGADGIKAFAEKMNTFGQKIKAAGMQLCYHNHAFEFEKVNDKYIIDHLFEATDHDLVKSELDVYWVVRGGEDPVSFLQNHAGRCPLLHMKDMANDKDKSFAPVGTGTLDMKAIIDMAKKTGAKWFIVEQDRTKLPVLEAIEISLHNLRELLKT